MPFRCTGQDLRKAMMWKTFTEEGQLKFQFLETVTHIIPMYVTRSIGGALYLVGAFIMVYNLLQNDAEG